MTTTTVYVLAAFLLALLLGGLILRKIKQAIFLLLIIVLSIGGYDVVVKNTNPLDELTTWKEDFVYAKDVGKITSDVTTDVNGIKSIVQAGSTDTASITKLNTYMSDLAAQQQKAASLKHSSRLDAFSDKYCSTLGDISTNAKTVTNLTGNTKAVGDTTGMLDTLSNSLSSLSNLDMSK